MSCNWAIRNFCREIINFILKYISSMYWKLVYGAPWIRCQVYVIGMLVGYFLRSRRHLKIHPVGASLKPSSTALLRSLI